MQLGGDNNRLLSEINVTPLVDVMLVLLIIFMVAAPMMIQGMNVDLPRTTAKPIDSKEQSIVLTIDKNQNISINNSQVPQSQIRSYLENLKKVAAGKDVLLRADKAVPYGYVIWVLAQMKETGIERVGMVTEPLGAVDE